MAAKFLILALALFAVVGLATAAGKYKEGAASSPTAAPINPPDASLEGADVGAPANNDAIGTTDGDFAAAAPGPGDDDVAVAGPLGSDATYANYPPAQSPSKTGGSAALTVSSIAGFAAMAASFFYL